MGFFSNFNGFNNTITQSNSSSTVFSTGSTIQINGQNFTGGNVSIINGKVIIDGEEVQYENNSKNPVINIVVQGNCGDITSDNGNITVQQNTNNVSSKNGTIKIDGSVAGSVDNKNGNISVRGNVQGNCITKNGNISK